jgi:uncharacterized protein YbcV (DUF1398 family)
MFTLTQIHDAHAKVKSGADFPHYIQDLHNLWIRSYTIFVSDGHAQYQGNGTYTITSPATYNLLEIHTTTDTPWFIGHLKLHQQWGSNYTDFCQHAAQAGIIKRVIDMDEMTCTYYDHDNNKVLVEHIPSV